MQFDTKIAVVLRDDLAGWQRTNVTAFLVSGIAGTVPGVVGRPYRDASGNEYLPMFVQPVLVYQADGPGLRRAFDRAVGRDVTPAIYTRELFATNHDEVNRAAVAGVATDDLDLVGIAFRAECKTGSRGAPRRHRGHGLGRTRPERPEDARARPLRLPVLAPRAVVEALAAGFDPTPP